MCAVGFLLSAMISYRFRNLNIGNPFNDVILGTQHLNLQLKPRNIFVFTVMKLSHISHLK